MPSGQHTYSGAELRTRDKAIEEKHAKEIAALEAKYNRLRYAFDSRSNELFDSQNYARKIAEKLGFRSLEDIQTFIDLADEQIPYKDLAKRVDELKTELAAKRRDKQALRDDLFDVLEQRDALRETVAEQSAKLDGSSAETIAQELVDLQAHCNAVSERAERAEKEFKERMGKWRAFKQWMQTEEKEYKEKRKGLRGTEKGLRDPYYARRQQKLKDMDLNSDEEPSGGFAAQEAPKDTPIPLKLRSTPPTFSSSPTVVATPAMPENGGRVPPRSPLVSSSSRTPLEFVSFSRRPTADQHSSPIPSALSMQAKDVIDLSETDDDSQSFRTFPNMRARQDDDIVVDPRPVTKNPLPAPHPTLPTRPTFPQFGVDSPKKQRHSDVFGGAPAKHVRPDRENADQERPRKARRFSSPVRTPLAAISTTARTRGSREGASTGTSRGRENRAGHAPASTPANTSASKQLTDYSAFKGRGRYGKAQAGNNTINASYAIDPAQNGGMDFQYDAVVRGKDDRRMMEGGDCECCRDYYEAVGPLPSRLQAPLWRSPPNSPEKRKPCRNGGRDDASTSHKQAITSHKQAISRHRHNWAQGSTPPGYWNIGFPNTQEAKNINDRAAEMHEQKLRMVQQDAENGGRYYKAR
ncbi:DNA repair protein endonuclease SAE2/CtIP C-terminus-domain-containing protein [Mycena vitilis]|nr:DNA repair protein endonuclease SAE2/CtIP C-terminus-domain-containing protein [Mycena vitilis]